MGVHRDEIKGKNDDDNEAKYEVAKHIWDTQSETTLEP